MSLIWTGEEKPIRSFKCVRCGEVCFVSLEGTEFEHVCGFHEDYEPPQAFFTNGHEKDEDCDVEPATSCCRICGVEHTDPCGGCGGRGFHREGCLWNGPGDAPMAEVR